MHGGNILFLSVNKNNVLIKSFSNFAIELYSRPDGFFYYQVTPYQKILKEKINVKPRRIFNV